MLDEQFWITNHTPTHPKGTGWRSSTPGNTVPLPNSSILGGGGLYPSSLCLVLGMVTLGSCAAFPDSSHCFGRCFSMEVIQAVHVHALNLNLTNRNIF